MLVLLEFLWTLQHPTDLAPGNNIMVIIIIIMMIIINVY